MTSKEIREKFIKFFEERGHKHIPSAPLVPENDPTTLFISAGMQPLVPYLLGEPHLQGKRLVNSQPSLRLEDIDEVGDNRHTTFFEMLGNWSLGDYFKKEQLAWFWEFLTKELGLQKEKLYVTVFEGEAGLEKDIETEKAWKDLGVPEDHIFYYGADKNWWSRSGAPDKMAVGDIGGPDSEVFFDFGTPHDSKYGEKCHPNCGCGRFLEIGNSVFIQYKKTENGLEELPQKSVDFGGGLERLTAAVNNEPDIFKIDLFWPIIEKIGKLAGTDYTGENKKNMQIIADHIRASAMLVASGVMPDKKRHGSALRKFFSRMLVVLQKHLIVRDGLLSEVAEEMINGYEKSYPILLKQKTKILGVFRQEEKNYDTRIQAGLSKAEGEFIKVYNLADEQDAVRLIETNVKSYIDPQDFLNKVRPFSSLGSIAAGTTAFVSQATYGVPFEYFEGLVEEQRWVPDLKKDEMQKAANESFKLHRELSKTSSAGMFKGGLAGDTPETRKLHTATHLLHQALRTVLGDHVQQKGSNITPERLRFDFSHPQALTQDEIKKVENLVNEKIKEALPVSWKETTFEEAKKEGALAFFGEKYGDKVKVYTIGPSSLRSSGSPFSREICGGPHVENTGEIGRVTITKEESAGSGVRRIYAVVENGAS